MAYHADESAPQVSRAVTTHAPRQGGMSFSVVVCTRNRPEWLEKCLQASSRMTYPHFELVVVDSASEDARVQGVAQRYGARYLREPRPGLSRARNRGAAASQADVVAYLDDDSIPGPDWLSNLVVEFEDPRVIAVTGRTVPLSLETEIERLAAEMNGYGASRPRMVVDRDTPRWFEMANWGGIGDGGNMAFRRHAFEIWRGFDERLGRGAPMFGGEEHDAFFSLLELGYRIVYTPQALVQHPYPRTVEELRTRYTKTLSGTAAYFTLLLVERPRYRRATLKYMLEALRGKPRVWRYHSERPKPRVASLWSATLAVLRGPFLYLWACVRRGVPKR